MNSWCHNTNETFNDQMMVCSRWVQYNVRKWVIYIMNTLPLQFTDEHNLLQVNPSLKFAFDQCTVGWIPYSGFCLWGPNLCKLCKLSQACKFYFCSYSCTFISARCTCHSSVLVIWEGHFCFTALPKRLKDCNGCVNHVHDDIATLLQCS